MASPVVEFKHLEIQLEDIKSATNKFDENKVIGRGGFGKVYKGELSHFKSREKSLVAIKRLDHKSRSGQGDPEFFKEIRVLSCYRHENVISLLGFCNQGGEMILVYEYASRGSLDHLLSSADLTWMQRLRICLDAAKGLSFLHDPNGTDQRVLHCDIKSSNILLDKNMTAKVSDFGLSKMGPANQQYSALITSPVGTTGYCDPLYFQTYSLTKESDVYSFGVVLFELMCGRQCVENINGQLKVYVLFWKKSYEDNKLDEIILQDLRQKMDLSSLKTFSDIAYQCLRNAREERPTMSRVVEELEIALESQEFPDLRLEVLSKYKDILMAADPRLIYKTGKQLKELLSKGLVINGKTLFCLNDKGQHIKRIFIQACLPPDEADYYFKHLDDNSRFPGGLIYEHGRGFKARVGGQYLTPNISYTLNLVFRYKDQSEVNTYQPLKYKIDGKDETKVLTIYPSTHMREDGWFVVPLYHFTSEDKTANFQFEFEFRYPCLVVAGFEFQPYEEKVELPVFEEYRYIVEAASQSLAYRSLQELKQILSKGIYLKDYKTWFSLNEKGENCHMISMEDCLIPDEYFPSRYKSDSQSRFPAGFYNARQKGFRTHVKTQLLIPLIPYTVNIVFNRSYAQPILNLKYRIHGETTTSTVYLPNPREDGFLMAELYQVTSNGGLIDLEIDFEDPGLTIMDLEGILFQPLEKVEDQVLEGDKVEDIQPLLDMDSDKYWGQKLPNDYEEILKMSKLSVKGKTKMDIFLMLYQGFLIDNGQQWFTIDKDGKKCQMLSTKATSDLKPREFWKSSKKSRFGEVLVISGGYSFGFHSNLNHTLLSPDTTYACYLVYNLPQDRSSFEPPILVKNKVVKNTYDVYYLDYIYSYLVSPPNTPVIGQKIDEYKYNTLSRHKLSALPRQRTDGWMEVKVWDFQTEKTPERVSMDLNVHHPEWNCGLIIQGIEIRPI